MSPTYYDRVQVTSTTTGTGTYTLGSAITGYRTFAVVGNGNSCHYCAQDVDGSGVPSGDWEVGTGTYTAAGTTLSRDTILSSSNANSAVNWGAGTRRIFITVPAAASSTIIHQASIELDDAEIKALPTTKQVVVPAPGVDRVIVLITGAVTKNLAVAYTNVAAAADSGFSLTLSVDDNQIVSTYISGQLLSSTNPGMWVVHLIGNPTAGTYMTDAAFSLIPGSNIDNAALVFQSYNGSNYTAGDASNTMNVAVEFRVFDLTTSTFLTTAESGWTGSAFI